MSSSKLEYLLVYLLLVFEIAEARKRTRSTGNGFEDNLVNSVEHIWSTTTVAVGDTAVIHCSFDALFQQLKNVNIDWVKDSDADETDNPFLEERISQSQADDVGDSPVVIATGKTLVVKDKRIRVFRPHNSVLSVLIVRRAQKKDAGVYRCNLAGSTTRHKFMVLNVTDSKIEAQTSSAETRVKVGNDVTLWCNATGYPMPIVYWTREDRNRKLQDGSYQYWGNGLPIKSASEWSTGVYVCYLDNFVQAVVNYKFSVVVEDSPWKLDGYKMRFDSSHWFPASTVQPIPTVGKSFLLMCDTRGSPNPPPTIKWYRGKELLSSGKLFYIIEDSSDWRQNFVSSTLVIMKYNRAFDGRYVCVASNGFRLRRQKFYLSETGEQPLHFIESFSRHKNQTKNSHQESTKSHAATQHNSNNNNNNPQPASNHPKKDLAIDNPSNARNKDPDYGRQPSRKKSEEEQRKDDAKQPRASASDAAADKKSPTPTATITPAPEIWPRKTFLDDEDMSEGSGKSGY